MNIHNITKQIRAFADELDAVDPYAELKAAHAAGKVIQYKCGTDAKCEWSDMNRFATFVGALDQYRIKPDEVPWIERHGENIAGIIAYREPKPKVPLGPEDVPPGSAVSTGKIEGAWAFIIAADQNEVVIQSRIWDKPICVSYEELRETRKINRSIPITGKWNPEAWEACEK
jgi:hypothetical protein